MNREQRKYVFERIEHKAKTKRDTLINLNNRATQTAWNADEKADFILKGEATLKPYEQIVAIVTKPNTAHDIKYGNPKYFDFYDYPVFTPVKPVKKLDNRLAEINAEANRLKDMCMLGDTTNLLCELSAFERKEF